MKRGEREKGGGGRKEEEGENLILFFSAVSTCHREFFSHFLSRPHASTLFPPQPSFSISFSLRPSLFSIILHSLSLSYMYSSPFLQSSITWPLLHILFSTFFFFLAVVCFLSVYCKNISLSLHWIYPLLYYFPSLPTPSLSTYPICLFLLLR